jgi:hypothetical protein
MKSLIIKTSLIAAALCLSLTTSAQEGHPLKGSWIGEWKGNAAQGDFVLMVLDWDGSKITGVINPGTDNMTIKEATLDPTDWSVHIEADGQANNQPVSYELDGKIEKLELPARSIVGTWKSQSGSGVLEIVRQ